MEVVNRIFGKYGNKLFINTELVLLFRLHGNSRPDGCCSHATHIWPNCRRGDGSTCDWGWEWTVSSTAHEAYQWYNFCKSYENITKFTKYMMKLGSIVTILFYWFGQAYAFCPVAPHVLGADFKRWYLFEFRQVNTPHLVQPASSHINPVQITTFQEIPHNLDLNLAESLRFKTLIGDTLMKAPLCRVTQPTMTI